MPETPTQRRERDARQHKASLLAGQLTRMTKLIAAHHPTGANLSTADLAAAVLLATEQMTTTDWEYVASRAGVAPPSPETIAVVIHDLELAARPPTAPGDVAAVFAGLPQ